MCSPPLRFLRRLLARPHHHPPPSPFTAAAGVTAAQLLGAGEGDGKLDDAPLAPRSGGNWGIIRTCWNFPGRGLDLGEELQSAPDVDSTVGCRHLSILSPCCPLLPHRGAGASHAHWTRPARAPRPPRPRPSWGQTSTSITGYPSCLQRTLYCPQRPRGWPPICPAAITTGSSPPWRLQLRSHALESGVGDRTC